MIALTNGGSQVLKLEGAVLIAFFGTVVVVISNMLTANWGSAASCCYNSLFFLAKAV